MAQGPDAARWLPKLKKLHSQSVSHLSFHPFFSALRVIFNKELK